MRNILFTFSFLYFESAAEDIEYPHCTEYRHILQKYQDVLNDHQKCMTQNGEQRAELRLYQNLITSGLQTQINDIKREERSGT